MQAQKQLLGRLYQDNRTSSVISSATEVEAAQALFVIFIGRDISSEIALATHDICREVLKALNLNPSIVYKVAVVTTWYNVVRGIEVVVDGDLMAKQIIVTRMVIAVKSALEKLKNQYPAEEDYIG